MRLIGAIKGESEARRFADFLLVKGIESSIEFEIDGSWAVWVHDEDRLESAGDLLKEFNEDPKNGRFGEATKAAASIREKEAEEKKHLEKRTLDSERLHRRFGSFRLGPVTIGLMAMSIAVFIYSGFGTQTDRISDLFLMDFSTGGGMIKFLPGMQEIRSGEIWRLFTPMFIHFDLMHIFFNLYILSFLGSMVESRQSSGYLVFLVFTISGLSNFPEYLATGHPNFGGMSGVVYGLVGYVWTREKFSPFSGYFMDRMLLGLSLIWLVLGVTNVIPHVANVVHAMGIFSGMVIGFIQSKLFRI